MQISPSSSNSEALLPSCPSILSIPPLPSSDWRACVVLLCHSLTCQSINIRHFHNSQQREFVAVCYFLLPCSHFIHWRHKKRKLSLQKGISSIMFGIGEFSGRGGKCHKEETKEEKNGRNGWMDGNGTYINAVENTGKLTSLHTFIQNKDKASGSSAGGWMGECVNGISNNNNNKHAAGTHRKQTIRWLISEKTDDVCNECGTTTGGRENNRFVCSTD